MILALLGHVELVSGHLVIARERFSAAATLYAAIGNFLYLPWCLEGLAGIAVAENDVNDAAFLLGAREAMLDIVGRGLPPADPPGFANTLASVREALGENAFSVAFEAGRSFSQEAIVALSTTRSGIPLMFNCVTRLPMLQVPSALLATLRRNSSVHCRRSNPGCVCT